MFNKNCWFLFLVFGSFVLLVNSELVDPNCGLKGPAANKRIVGGVNTDPLEFPWQGSLRYYSSSAGWYHTCGCSLISKRWVLTAAHCVNRSNIVDPTMYKFVGGEHDKSVTEGNEVELSIEKIIVSPLWDAQKIDGDHALLKLERDIDLEGKENHLGTVCIPEEEPVDQIAGKKCIATGWGHTEWQGTTPNILQKVEVDVWDHQSCVSRYSWIHTITDRMLCFGENKKGTCQGDSGGPLNCNINNRWYTYGATSFGVQCAGPTFPSVTARVTAFSEWIQQIVKNN